MIGAANDDMSNQVYQSTVEELEAILSPRVVSRSLQEGLRQLGRSPDTVDVDAVEKILKAQIYRQLQVTMPVTQAKQAIEDILGRLQGVADGASTNASADVGLARQNERLGQLKDALKPFNLYFEWPEVQKLRAQVQLLETEQASDREAASLADDAEAQLHVVEQKLEDHLVIQARELGELSEALDQVRTLGGPKIRRLENLVNQIGEAQAGRQLAPAEIERARRLARDLRKLMESSVYSEDMQASTDEASPSDGTSGAVDRRDGGVLDVEGEEEDLLSIDTADLGPEVSAKLLLLDLEDERHDLDALVSEYDELLGFQPSLRAGVDALRERLDADASIADTLPSLRRTLEEAFETYRATLRDELQGIEVSLRDLRSEVDTSELRQSLRVGLGILSTTLPNQADIHHIRNLYQLALDQVEAFDRAEDEARAQRDAQLHDQSAMLERLESTLLRYEGHAAVDAYQQLEAQVDALRAAQGQEVLDPQILDTVRRAEASLESAIAVLADQRVDRQRATLRNLLAQVQALPGLDTVGARISSVVAELERQLQRLEAETLEDAQVEATASMVEALKGEATATLQRRLEALAARAGELSSAPLLERIRTAMDGLDDGNYPDLNALKAAIAQEREAERSDQIGELHRLERETARFGGMEGPNLEALQQRLATARQRIDEGHLAPGLSQTWALLERVQAEVDERLRNIVPRLDAALEAFTPVEKLNSDDVATVRRILRHLDSQRDALERVSVGLRLQLEGSLSDAETLLVKLREEYEATRVIADQLVNANVLDDVLGLFGSDAPAGDAAAGSVRPADIEALLQPYLSEDEVSGAAIFAKAGECLAGLLPFEPDVTSALLDGLLTSAELGATALGQASPRLATLEYEGGVVVAAWPTSDHTLLITLRSSSDLSLLTHRLRRDLEALAVALPGTHGGADHGGPDHGGPAHA
jgi:predicted regulator of Ras-like GTPase activity (Roadblock/LC7/MglB family)